MPLTDEMREWIRANRKPSAREVHLTYHGVTRSLREWSVLLGVEYKTLNKRLQRGWTTEQALETPRKINKHI